MEETLSCPGSGFFIYVYVPVVARVYLCDFAGLYVCTVV